VDSENLKMPDEQRIRVGGPRGPIGAADRGRRFALDEESDMFGRRRRNFARPMPVGGDDGFSRRFPNAVRIRTV
jgi:hypothetical protein